MLRVFLDANIFVAATASSTGGSRLLLELSAARQVKTVTVRHALLEAERNVAKKLPPQALGVYYNLLAESQITIQPIYDVNLADIRKANSLVPLKDVPILLGAVRSRCAVLITLDQADFLSNAKLRSIRLPFEIMTPGDFIQKYFL